MSVGSSSSGTGVTATISSGAQSGAGGDGGALSINAVSSHASTGGSSTTSSGSSTTVNGGNLALSSGAGGVDGGLISLNGGSGFGASITILSGTSAHCQGLAKDATGNSQNIEHWVDSEGLGPLRDRLTELVKFLGVVANSGTSKFLDTMKDGTADVSQIVQFGVGF